MYLFTHYLQEKVVNSISELYSFMDKSNSTLDLKVLGEVADEEPAEYADQVRCTESDRFLLPSVGSQLRAAGLMLNASHGIQILHLLHV